MRAAIVFWLRSLAAPWFVFASKPKTPQEGSSQEEYERSLSWMVWQRSAFHHFIGAWAVTLGVLALVGLIVTWVWP